jgi:hypothetical protein
VRPATILVALLLASLVVLLQWRSGALEAEFAAHPDEAAHYVSGLLVRDYIAAGFPQPALRFAEDYYLHYPKVAIGHWPPFFYVVQGVWMLAFSPGRISIMLLLALLTSVLAMKVYSILREEYGVLVGATAAAILVCLPLMQGFSQAVMSELLIALLSFYAAVSYGKYLDAPSWREAVKFALLAVLAIMTNGKGLALALLPPFAILIGRRVHLARRLSFWFPALLVIVLCGPWYYLTTNRLAHVSSPSAIHTKLALLANGRVLIHSFGWLLFCVIAIGLVRKVLWPMWRNRAAGKWVALASLILSVWTFHSFVNVYFEPRYAAAAIPALAAFLGAGLAWLAAKIARSGLRPAWSLPLVVLLSIAAFAKQTFLVRAKPRHGQPQLVSVLLGSPQFRSSVFLVAGSSSAEGAFIAEVAMHERRPGHIVLRASKMLASISWTGVRYQALFPDAQAMAAYLESLPVGIVAFDTAPVDPPREHLRQLGEVLRRYPDRWESLNFNEQSSSTVRAYRLVGHEGKPVGKIRIDLSGKLGKVLEH